MLLMQKYIFVCRKPVKDWLRLVETSTWFFEVLGLRVLVPPNVLILESVRVREYDCISILIAPVLFPPFLK